MRIVIFPITNIDWFMSSPRVQVIIKHIKVMEQSKVMLTF